MPRLLNGISCLRRYRAEAIIQVVANLQILPVLIGQCFERNGGRGRVWIVITSNDVEEKLQIFHSASHRAYHTKEREGAVPHRIVSRSWHPAGRRLQAANTAEVRRHSDGSSSVTSYTPGRHTGGNGGRLSAPRSSRSARQAPGVVGAACQFVTCAIWPQRFWRAGVS